MSGARWSRTLLAVAVATVLAASALRAQTQVKAILFDSYGTLVSWEGVEEALGQVFRRKGLNTDPAAFNQLWRSKQLVYIMYNTLVDKGFEPFSFVTRRALHTAARFGTCQRQWDTLRD